MKKFIFLLIVTPLIFIGCEDSCVDLVCDNGLADQDVNGICFCNCVDGFTGERCDECVEGFTGDNCDQPIVDPCENVSCENEGECIDGTCDCPDGFIGDNCEELDPCWNVACTNNGIYSILDGVCTCECNEGFSGDDCSIEGIEMVTEVTGDWNATDLCEMYYNNQPIPYVATIQQNMMGDYEIINFAAIDTSRAFSATIEGNMISVPLSEVSDEYGTILVEGMGTFSEGGDTINWIYTTDIGGVIDNCTGMWTKGQ